METIIVEIVIAVTGDVVDFVLPAHIPVSKLLEDVTRLVEQAFPHLTFDRECPMLCDGDRQAVIPAHQTLAQAGVRDSSRLLLV